MNNEERKAQRELFDAATSSNDLLRSFYEYDCGNRADLKQKLFKVWLKALESQPKREIRLPECETRLENIYKLEIITALLDQGFTVL